MELLPLKPFKFTKTLSRTDASLFLDIGTEPSRRLTELGLLMGPLELIRVRGRGVRRWPVSLTNASRVCIGRGWKQFISDNKLRCGNTLHFTLMSSSTTVPNNNNNPHLLLHQIKVEVTTAPPAVPLTKYYKTTHGSSVPPLKKPRLASKSSVPPLVPMEAIRSCLPDNCNSKLLCTGAAHSLIPLEKELFMTFYIRVNLHQPFILQIPKGITKLMPKLPCTACLQCDCKRLWIVDLLHDSTECSTFLRDSGGFLRDHNLNQGDLCMFKSVSFDNSKFHVYVYKSHHAKPYCPISQNTDSLA